ncbi:hypothetical protein Tco_0494054 [Tanacetum coccineum]
MTTSSGSTPLLVPLPFRGIPIRTFLETLFQSQLSLTQTIMLSLLHIRLHSGSFRSSFFVLVGMSRYYTLDEDTYLKMDLSAFIHVVDPTKVKVVERECAEGEKKLLESTVGHVVPLLPVAPAHSESELEASV